jgi:hypothetical protein
VVRPSHTNRAEPCSAHFLFLFLKNALAGGCRAPKFPAAAPLWRRSFGILSSPDRGGLPSTCDDLPDEMFFTVLKDILFARAELAMCECREPFGNPPRGLSGVRSASDATRYRARIYAQPVPLPYGERKQGSPNKTRVR